MSYEKRSKIDWMRTKRSGSANHARFMTTFYFLPIFISWWLSSIYFLLGWLIVVLWYVGIRSLFSQYDESVYFPPSWPIYQTTKSIRISSMVVLPAFASASGRLITKSQFSVFASIIVFISILYFWNSMVTYLTNDEN